MTTRQLRLVRAASVSSVATLLAALSHTFASGAAPHPLLVLAVSVLIVPIAALLLGVRLSKARVALTVLVSQTAFHVIFQVLGAPTGSEPRLGHQHGPLALNSVSIAALPEFAMVIWHVLAAVATTALLWHGESLVRAIAGWMLALIRHPGAIVPADHRRPAILVSHRHPLIDHARSAAVTRRGPPLFS
ncbi:MAG: hypothetical protein QM630_07140 [Microbacterium sp.]